MRRLAGALLTIAAFASSAEAAERYLVATRTAPRDAAVRVLRDPDELRAHAVRSFEFVKAFAANLTSAEVAELRRSADVRFVAPVVERHASVDRVLPKTPNGSIYSTTQTLSYGVTMIHAPQLWPLTKGAGVNVAVLDTGLDITHPDLAANYAGGFNTFVPSADPIDDNGHGTHVAGIVAAVDNNIGVIGVAPQVRLWAIKVLDRVGFGYDENVVAGVDWVISKKREVGGNWIMSLSLGASGDSQIEHEAFDRALAEGVIVAAAAGNRSFPDVEYPAHYDGVIAVGAVDADENLAVFSDHGPHLGVVAPGVRILSTARVGSVSAAAVTLATGASVSAAPLVGSSRGQMKGQYVSCGLGNPEDFPSEVKGKIALIRRGSITFNQKVRNAQNAGAVSVVIFNKDDSDFTGWTLIRPDCQMIDGCDDATHPWPLALAISAADGQRLLDEATQVADMGAWYDDYKTLSGTSQATPHVSGALALIWSLAPTSTAQRVKEVLIGTAFDLGDPGFDLTYGNGLIDVLAAAKTIAPWRFKPPDVPNDPKPLPDIP